MLCSSGIVWTGLLQTQSIWHCFILLTVRGRDRAAGAGEDHLVRWQCFHRAMMISMIELMFVSDALLHWHSVCSFNMQSLTFCLLHPCSTALSIPVHQLHHQVLPISNLNALPVHALRQVIIHPPCIFTYDWLLGVLNHT